jgi:hypothetical protein
VAAGVAVCASVTVIAFSAIVSPSIESSDNPPTAAAADTPSGTALSDEGTDKPARRSGNRSRSRSGDSAGDSTETAQATPGASAQTGTSRSDTGTSTRRRGGRTTQHDSDGGATAGRLSSGGTSAEEEAGGDLSFTQLPVIGRPVTSADEPAPGDTAGEGQGGEEPPSGGAKEPPADSTTAP